MVFHGEARVGAEAQEGVEAKGLVLHARQFGVSVAIVVICIAVAYLPVQEDASLAVVRYQGGIGCGDVLKGGTAPDVHECVSHLGRVVQGILGDNIDGTANGRSAIEGRPAATNHLNTLYHVGRNLFQTVHTGQCGEDGARVDENLRVVAVQTIDAHLCEATVLAVVFGAHAGLVVESLCQAGGLGGLKFLAVHHVYQVRCLTTLCFATVGRNHHLVQRNVVRLHDEVHLAGLISVDDYLTGNGTETGVADLQSNGILGQVLEEVVTGSVCCGGDGSAQDANGHIGQVLLLVGIDYMADDVCIGLLVVGPNKRNWQEGCQHE